MPGYQGNLQAAISHNASLAAWERLGVEFILTFVVVLTYFISTDSVKKVMGNSAPSIAASYSACSFVSVSLQKIGREGVPLRFINFLLRSYVIPCKKSLLVKYLTNFLHIDCNCFHVHITLK